MRAYCVMGTTSLCQISFYPAFYKTCCAVSVYNSAKLYQTTMPAVTGEYRQLCSQTGVRWFEVVGTFKAPYIPCSDSTAQWYVTTLCPPLSWVGPGLRSERSVGCKLSVHSADIQSSSNISVLKWQHKEKCWKDFHQLSVKWGKVWQSCDKSVFTNNWPRNNLIQNNNSFRYKITVARQDGCI